MNVYFTEYNDIVYYKPTKHSNPVYKFKDSVWICLGTKKDDFYGVWMVLE